MAMLQKCSRCKSTIDVSYFSISRKNEYFKTCDNCRTKSRESKAKQCQQLDVKPLKRTDTDFVDEEFESMKKQIDTDFTPEPTPVIVFDVEHTGCSEAFVLQLSWGLYQRDGTLIKMKDYYLKPEGEIYIHPRASEITGITFETLLQKENVLPIQALLKEFANDVSNCEVLVAHNINNDIKTLNKEFVRHNMDELKANLYCTMAQTKKFCNCIDKRNRLKNPRLDELHQKLFNSPIESTRAHNSCYDVEICAKCYFKCKDMKI